MHYRNGREAKNGDKIVSLNGDTIVAAGILRDAVPGNDYCNGNLDPLPATGSPPCLCDCLHVGDVAILIAAAGLDARPAGK